ncbi:hypothetical protein [Nocardia sp. NPDC057440]|uniref:hypothetical protein n=1 Tax=Nocardia sp. NPDC057440 TaxID=3346134 RepID=UPI00366FDFD6
MTSEAPAATASSGTTGESGRPRWKEGAGLDGQAGTGAARSADPAAAPQSRPTAPVTDDTTSATAWLTPG